MAGTDTSKELILRPTPTIILVEPQLGENIGTAARAMANFGLWDLRVVNPRDGWPNERARAAAAKADHVIDRVQVFDTLAEALTDINVVYATTARSREMFKPVYGPDVIANETVSHIARGQKVGILFGRERWGLKNEEVAVCDAIVTLPVEPAFASLNIAQAVLVIAYEWRRAALHELPLPISEEIGVPATRDEVIGMVDHLGEALDRSNFFKSEGKRHGMMNNIMSLFMKAGFNTQEVRTMRGMFASLDRRHERPNPNRPNSYLNKPIKDETDDSK